MSADNGVYILKTKDQYRVILAQAIKNIFDGRNKLKPVEVVYLWNSVRHTRDEVKAMDIDKTINSRTYTEYGIKTFTYNKTWKHIVEDAKNSAKWQLENISSLDNFQISKLNYVLGITI